MATTQPEELQTHPTTGTSVPSAAGTAAPLTPSEPRPTLKDWFRFATIVIIALNVLMFVIMVAQGVSFISPTAESVLKWGADWTTDFARPMVADGGFHFPAFRLDPSGLQHVRAV